MASSRPGGTIASVGRMTVIDANCRARTSLEGMARASTSKVYAPTMSETKFAVTFAVPSNNGMMSEKGGGGLGMIDIARKSGEKLVYNFTPINEITTFFSLAVKIAE